MVFFNSPTYGRLDFEEMFARLAAFVEADPDSRHHVIIGTDSAPGEEICYITAVVVHRLGHGGCYFYTRSREQVKRSLNQRIFYEAAMSLEMASRISQKLSENGWADLPLEIHLDIGDKGETRKIIQEVVGMVSGSGYKVRTKPNSYGASKVADRHTHSSHGKAVVSA